MKTTKLIAIVFIISSLAAWARDGRFFSILETLPFAARRSHALSPAYEWAALAICLLGLWGYLRLRRPR